MHYNGYPTAEINGGPAPGYSTGQAQEAMERLARRELPNGMSFEWTELTYQQILAGNTAVYRLPAGACCSCSWCWPRSTRACACRWR